MFDLFVRHDILGCSGCQVIITHTHEYFLCICIVTSTYSPLPSDDTRFVLFLNPYCVILHCIMDPLQFVMCVVPTTLFLYPIFFLLLVLVCVLIGVSSGVPIADLIVFPIGVSEDISLPFLRRLLFRYSVEA